MIKWGTQQLKKERRSDPCLLILSPTTLKNRHQSKFSPATTQQVQSPFDSVIRDWAQQFNNGEFNTGLKEDLYVQMLYQNKAIFGATTIFCVLSNCSSLQGFEHTRQTETNHPVFCISIRFSMKKDKGSMHYGGQPPANFKKTRHQAQMSKVQHPS